MGALDVELIECVPDEPLELVGHIFYGPIRLTATPSKLVVDRCRWYLPAGFIAWYVETGPMVPGTYGEIAAEVTKVFRLNVIEWPDGCKLLDPNDQVKRPEVQITNNRFIETEPHDLMGGCDGRA